MLLLGICLAYSFSSNVYAVRKGDTYTFDNGAYLYADTFGSKPIYYLYIPKSVGKPEIIHDYEVYGTGNRGDFIAGGWIARYFAVIPFGQVGIYDAHMALYDNGAIVDSGDYWRVRVRGMVYTTPGYGSTTYQTGGYVTRDYYGNTTKISAGTTMTCTNKFEFWPLINGRQPGPVTSYDSGYHEVGWTNNYQFDDEGGKETRFYAHGFTYAASSDSGSVWQVPTVTFPTQAIHQHSYTVTANATCTANGTKTCSCGDTQTIPATGHSYTLAANPTCTTNGYRRCACGDTQIIPATGHSWGSYQKVKDPTVYEPGSEVRTCRNNSAHTEARAIAKKNFTIFSGSSRVQNIYLGTSLIMNAASGNSGLVK